MARQREIVTNFAQRPRFTLGRAHYARRVPGAFTFEKTLVKVKKTRTCYGYETRVGLTRAKKQESQRDSTNRPKYVVDDFNVNVPNVSKSFAQTISWMARIQPQF